MNAELVRCPQCRRGRVAWPDAAAAEARCDSCGSGFPYADGILDLLPGTRQPRSFWQTLMESDAVVSVYESRLWRRSFVAYALMGMDFDTEQQIVLDAAAPAPSSRVLDLACGSGIYTRPLARLAAAGHVVGLDLSWPMLRHASRRLGAEGPGNVRLIRGSALQLPFADGTFDVVNCCGALHLFPDVPRVLGEVQRVLRPDGRFTCAVAQRVEGRVQDVANQYGRAWTGLHAFRQAELAAGLERAGLDEIRCHSASGRWMILSARKTRRTA